MTDQPLLPPPEEPSAPPKARQTDLVPWFYGLGFLILAGAIFYIWQYPSTSGEAAAQASAIQAIDQHLAELDSRLNRLEQRPAPDLSKITGRIDVLDGRLIDQTQVSSRLDTLSGRIESLSVRDQTGLDTTRQLIGTLTARVATFESKADSLDAAANRLNQIARLQQASIAMASGQAIGDLPNAPPTLIRYAHKAPPTEDQLRTRFRRDEQAALAANQPDAASQPFVDRVWERAQGLITIRRGEDVVVGNQSAVLLNRAQAALESGDLPGAVSAVAELKGQPGQAMAGWLAEARSLLDARSALAEMAAQT